MTARRRRLRRRVLIATGSLCGVAVAAAAIMQMRAADADASGTAADSAAAPVRDSVPPLVLTPPPPLTSDTDSVPADSAARPAPPPPRRTASLTIVAPAAARVYLDGRSVGSGRHTARDLQPGEHTVRAEIPDSPRGCASATQARVVRLAAGESESIPLTPVGCGTLALAPTIGGRPIASDAGAAYTLEGPSGTRRGAVAPTAELLLPAGSYRVAIATPNCAPFDATVRVETGERVAPSIRLYCPPR